MHSIPLYPRLSSLTWLIVSVLLVVLPHAFRIPVWIVALFLGVIAWRYLLAYWQWRLPPTFVIFGIALLAMAGVLVDYRTIFGRDAGVTLLVALCGLKLLEITNQRDALLVCFLSYFLVITNFLYSQSIPTALYMTVVVLVITATLVSLSDANESVSLRKRLQFSGVLLLQSLPIMLVIFILFPRVTGPFWALPKDAQSKMSGLDDTLTLGNISELSLSDEIAFRVKFEGELPPPSARYWRGPVLWWTDGKRWSINSQNTVATNLKLDTTGQPIHYTVTLEPHNERWLLALDVPTNAPSEVVSHIMEDYQLLSTVPIQQRIRYSLTSYTNYQAQLLTEQQQRLAVRLPPNQHPKTRALAAQWYSETPQPEAFINRILKYFNQEEFFYTLEPAPLNGDLIDSFFFETRQGFCEHYATTFTILTRAVGIPTRLVTGYLGGTYNPIGGYLIVRQRDAHVWNEVWLEGKGWVRVDPTSAVAPERIEQGIDSALEKELDPLGENNKTALGKMWRQMLNSWDTVNNAWNQWVLGYDVRRQSKFLNQLGLTGITWQGMTIGLVVAVASLLLMVSAWIFLRGYHLAVRDPIQRIYLRFCRKMARFGFHRHPSEGPLRFAQRIIESRPELKSLVEQVTTLYIQSRYRSQAELLPELRKVVRQCRFKF